jgi:hypothetical protein
MLYGGRGGVPLGLNLFGDLTNDEFWAAYLEVKGATERYGRVMGERSCQNSGLEGEGSCRPRQEPWPERKFVGPSFSAMSTIESIKPSTNLSRVNWTHYLSASLWTLMGRAMAAMGTYG